VRNARPLSAAAIICSLAPAAIPVSGCVVAVGPPIVQVPLLVGTTGEATARVPIRNEPQYLGVRLYAQWAVVDPSGALFGVIALSDGHHIHVGT
jgi:hypothetical protein